MAAPYHHQMSAPAGAYLAPSYQGPPTHRGPSNTLPPGGFLPPVPDDAIINSSMPRQHSPQLYHQVYENVTPGMRDFRAATLDKQSFYIGTSTLRSNGTTSPDDSEWDMTMNGDEDKKKEKEVLRQNRSRLTEYVHDCTVLFPYMREKNVFNRHDCDKINHEITGTLKMDTFIDIVLTKGPQAIGVFHESLETHYPAVFDVLCGLFTNAGISLPESRQKKERPEYDEDSPKGDENSTGHTINQRGLRSREGLRTIRIRLKELSKHCEQVQNQRDQLQNSLRMREQDIDALISRIDQKDAQNSELMSKLELWRESLTVQSNGSIQQLNDILEEKESIQKEYTLLAGELELTVSELMAARDRISKLLVNLDRTDKQAAAAGERNEKLAEKVQMQDGEIQKLLRKIDRLKSDGYTPPTPENVPTDKRIEELEGEIAQLKTDCEDYKERSEVASRERRYALDEKDQAMRDLHKERTKNSRLKSKVKDLKSQLNDFSSQNSAVLTPDQVGVAPFPGGGALTRNDVVDKTVFMTAEDAGLELGLAVVVRKMAKDSKAYQEGDVRLGDEIREVQRVKVLDSNDPLSFARQMVSNVSQTVVTLTIRRQAPAPIFEGRAACRSPMQLHLRDKPARKISNISVGKGFSAQTSAKSSSTSTRSHDTTSGTDTRDSDLSMTQSDSEEDDHHGNRVSHQTNTDDSDSGAIYSPTHSNVCPPWSRGKHEPTLTGKEFGNVESSEQGPKSLEHLPQSSSASPHWKRKDGMYVRKHRKNQKIKLSKSLDDMDKVKLPGTSPVLADGVDGSRVREFIVQPDQWENDFTIVGGRGNGLFVKSNCSIRGLNTGDQILQIGDHPTKVLMYAEALEMLNGLKSYYYIAVTENKSAYDQLMQLDSTRDNFYVRAKYSHHKNRGEVGMEYSKGDVLHVLDTKPRDFNGFWRVEKVNKSTGEPTIGGYIPVTLDEQETMDSTNSLPVRVQSPRLGGRPFSPRTLARKLTPAKRAYEFYEPLTQVTVTMPRPVVLLGACETEVRKGLVEQGMEQGLKFAFCLRESVDKLNHVSQDQIVETVVSDGELFKSTIDHVTGAANQGYHCVLCILNDELVKPSVTSLHPIVLILTPRKGFKNFRDPQSPNARRNQLENVPQYVAGLKRKYAEHISGEVFLSVGMCLDDALHVVRETVAKKQEEIVWTPDV